MGKSDFQQRHQTRLQKIAQLQGIDMIPEMWLPKGRYVDLGTKDRKYGIEIKSCTGDLKTGYGLNVNDFEYAYIAIPEKFVNQAIGYAYMTKHRKCGVIAIGDDDTYKIVKPAIANIDSGCGNVLDMFISSADAILNIFNKYKAVEE